MKTMANQQVSFLKINKKIKKKKKKLYLKRFNKSQIKPITLNQSTKAKNKNHTNTYKTNPTSQIYNPNRQKPLKKIHCWRIIKKKK